MPRKFNCEFRGSPRNFICLAVVSRGIYQIRHGICQILPRKTVGPNNKFSGLQTSDAEARGRPKLCFGYGFGAETAKFLGFGLVSVTAVTRILVSAWFRLRP